MKPLRLAGFAAHAGLSLILLTAGCQTGAYAPRHTTIHNLEQEAEFVLLDGSLQRSVTCTSIARYTSDDGRIGVTASIRNRDKSRLELEVNCVFKDDHNVPLDETAWEKLFLTEKSTEGVRFITLNNKAKRFTIRVRQAR